MGISVTSRFETSLTGAESGHKNVFKNYTWTRTGLFYGSVFSLNYIGGVWGSFEGQA